MLNEKNIKMKKISTILFLLISGLLFSQSEAPIATLKESKIISLVYSVDSLEELKTINWDDVKEIFNRNENKDESIVLGFKVKRDVNDSEPKFKHSVEVKGKMSDLEGTIEITRKMIKVIEKL